MNILFLIGIFIKMSVCVEDRRVITTLKYSPYVIRPLVVNGVPADYGQVPYLVSLKDSLEQLSPGRKIWTNLCGGSIISKTKVLTAAHCFESNNFYYFFHRDLLRIVAGNMKTDLVHHGNTETTDHEQWRSISGLIIHPDFHFPSDDIALVFVDIPWEFTKGVDYIQPASRTTDYSKNCFSAGYGSLSNSTIRLSKVLLVANIDPMPRIKCSFVWQMNMDHFICTNSLVSDVSRGDSGGPLACVGTEDPLEKVGRQVLVGIVSGKNFDKTTLFTRVSAFKAWIDNNSGSKLKISCLNILAIILLILIYLLFHWFPLIVEREANIN